MPKQRIAHTSATENEFQMRFVHILRDASTKCENQLSQNRAEQSRAALRDESHLKLKGRWLMPLNYVYAYVYMRKTRMHVHMYVCLQLGQASAVATLQTQAQIHGCCRWIRLCVPSPAQARPTRPAGRICAPAPFCTSSFSQAKRADNAPKWASPIVLVQAVAATSCKLQVARSICHCDSSVWLASNN